MQYRHITPTSLGKGRFETRPTVKVSIEAVNTNISACGINNHPTAKISTDEVRRLVKAKTGSTPTVEIDRAELDKLLAQCALKQDEPSK